MGLTVHKVAEPEFDLGAVKDLFREYNSSIQIDLGFQDFEKELQALPGKYHPEQNGQLFLAFWNDQPAGCVGIYQLKPGVCELKRLYVKPEFQGLKMGKALMDKAIAEAIRLGYSTLVLDSLKRMESAGAIYQKMGFREIEPYNYNPYPDVYYMALDLSQVSIS